MGVTGLKEALSRTSYPGRGIIIGTAADSERAFLFYFIMGRSENSRNRVFVTDGTGIRTKAADPSKLTDPSLIIYSPVRTFANCTIVTNGDQTDTIFDMLKTRQQGEFDTLSYGKSIHAFDKALRSRTFEPDAPNYTPRISGLAYVNDSRLRYALSILRSNDGDPMGVKRFTFTYEAMTPGEGHLIHTYADDGEPLPSFGGEPVTVEIGDDLTKAADTVWEALNEENKVSLFAREINLKGGSNRTIIINKYDEV